MLDRLASHTQLHGNQPHSNPHVPRASGSTQGAAGGSKLKGASRFRAACKGFMALLRTQNESFTKKCVQRLCWCGGAGVSHADMVEPRQVRGIRNDVT